VNSHQQNFSVRDACALKEKHSKAAHQSIAQKAVNAIGVAPLLDLREV
jgi:hypothetical protein